ncbi:DUF547 domain-containing protein [Marinibaculum pumilum]|uniref:DUF547 domain-containing protein n=1 Tax=Marinibaculum pumilum TaxID=1766165 RepID=A0ABV7KX36_9PROT
MTGLSKLPGRGAGGAAWAPLRCLLLLLALPLLAGFGGLSFNAGPDAELLPHWQAQDAGSTVTVDHAPWQLFLDRHLRPNPVPGGPALVAYGAVTAADRAALRAYIDRLAGIEVTALNRAEQFAYWINLYNALTVDLVLAHYPVATIRDIDISPGLFADGPWGRDLVNVEGRALSLDDISSTASCARSGRTRASTMPSTAPRSAAPPCRTAPSPPPMPRRCWTQARQPM